MLLKLSCACESVIPTKFGTETETLTVFSSVYKLIIEFVNYLQDSIFGDTQNISDLKVSNKLFSAKGYNFNDLNGNTYLTSLE